MNTISLSALSVELAGQAGSLVAFHCDLNDSDQIETLFATVREQFGGIDVCVNNAGLYFTGSLLNGNVEKWRTILNVNVLAVAHCAQLAIRSMRDRNVDEGQVINICSLSGHRVPPNPDVHFYAASKYAMTALTEGLRQELAAEPPTKIRVAQISPGLVQTEIAARAHNEPGRVMELGVEAKNIADAVLYILSTPPELQSPMTTVAPPDE
ncbi:Dehydrogenase/reductase SDR family member 11 [Amphibalanus amphitrite]|uniref:Dehydrogenase/reductase SDR family member 11 n=1 Tax=Amphibalanus amphitrite TaxID=1232801 RepID=A0A6A4W990_AMPAM|nr:Dehydrogenase/reductase SDR family member 11 [Amphibalanus amphitrite]